MNSRRRSPAPWVLLAALALTGAAPLAACGDEDGATEARIEREREEAARIARQEERIKQLEREARQDRRERNRSKNDSGGGSGSSSGSSGGSLARDCGGGVSANNVTSCPFAQEVRNAYVGNVGSGGGTVTAYSSATSQYYEMSCKGGSPHVCTGGRGAEVRFP